MHRIRRGRRRSRGVTLIEILVVLGIMALIAGAVAFGVIPIWRDAQIRTTTQAAIQLRGVAVGFRVTHMTEECPTIAMLRVDQTLDAASKTTDAWGEPYHIVCDEASGRGGEITVLSSGPDRKMGTTDDIIAPPPPPRVAVQD